MSWSAAQLRILRELGHEPMQLATAAASAPAARDSDPGPRVQEPQATAAPTRAPGTGLLAAALARAAAGGDLAALGLDLERLRGEPALKRALWPKLRALRRAH